MKLLWLAACTPAPEPLVAEHVERYPAMQAQDVYKLLHHAVMGPGHAAPSREAASDWLDRELATLGSARDREPTLEDLGEGLARVHLRPYLAAGGDEDALLDAFLATADAVRGDPRALERRLARAVATVDQLGLSSSELAALVDRQRAAGWTAVHHSEAYVQAYAPAYRVVKPALLPPAP